MTAVALAARVDAIKRLASEQYDLLVIGGGITGVGIAQDAAARGMQVALVERGDYAIGTSSRSSKLIHGGLRYLAQGDFRVTYESCSERALLQKLAPHLVRSRTFLIPVYRWMHGLTVATGLWLYDIISKLKSSSFHKRVNVAKAKKFAPTIETEGLLFGYLFNDCQTSDARLVMEVAKSATSLGATTANYLEVVGLLKDGAQVIGARARDQVTDREIEIRAKVVVNATGVWMDTVRSIDETNAPRKVRPAKGVHILIPRERIPTQDGLFFESASQDGRSLFFIPWYEGTIIGTTDTDYQGEIDSPRASNADIDYILSSAQRIFPAANLTHSDILSSYAGLRPLIDEGGKSTKDISREHRIFESESGMISIAGGKLTTYRRMASGIVDLALNRLRARYQTKQFAPNRTEQIYLSGFTAEQSLAALQRETTTRAEEIGLDSVVALHLVEDYGVNAGEVLAIAASRRELATRILAHLPFIKAEVIYAIRAEQATRLDDFLVRRTRIAYHSGDQGEASAQAIAQLMAAELGWDEQRVEQEIKRYNKTVRQQYSP